MVMIDIPDWSKLLYQHSSPPESLSKVNRNDQTNGDFDGKEISHELGGVAVGGIVGGCDGYRGWI